METKINLMSYYTYYNFRSLPEINDLKIYQYDYDSTIGSKGSIKS